MQSLEQARLGLRVRSVRWGFAWALWCAVLWGAWYLPGTAVWYELPYREVDAAQPFEFLMAAILITALSAIAATLFLFLWLAVLGKWGEYARTVRQMRKISKWFVYAALFGGPCALLGSYLAIGYVGPIFAAVAALMYPIVGASLARLWYRERISRRAALGMFIIIAGGVSVFAPGIFGEFSGTDGGAWLGYLGGAMAAIGWGVEGAIAGRVLDVTDPDVGITVRFSAEILLWSCLVLPAVALFSDYPLGAMLLATMNFKALLWLTLSGMSFGFCYVAWYKSFPLIGVGRGQAIAALYAVFAVIFLAIFTLQLPEWHFLLGLSMAVLGGFVMFTEGSESVEVVREIGGR